MAKKRNLKKALVMAVLLLGMAPAIAAGGTIYVDVNTPDNNDGSSWAKAYKYLQDALSVAQDGNDIWVAEGTYRPDANTANPNGSDDRYATFQLINGVAIYGGFAGGESSLDERNWQTNETILSGDIGTPDYEWDNSYHVVTGSGTEPNAVLDGFIITAGNANGANPDWDWGGGMWIDIGAGPTVNNCFFKQNSALSGGGGMCSVLSSPTLTNCTFSKNKNRGYCNLSGDPTLTDCTFSNNTGCGMSNFSYTNPTLINCTFNNNNGGGFISGGSNGASGATLMNCIFSGNLAERGGGLYASGGNGTCTITLTNCIFSGNSAERGGGLYAWGGNGSFSVTLTNCTFSENSASNSSGSMYAHGANGSGSLILTNCVLWGNTASDGYEIALYNASTIDVNYCDVKGGQADIYNDGTGTVNWGSGNIDEDPCFVDADSNDYHLLPDSPCIDAGDNTAVPPDTTDLDGDGNTTEPIPFDLDGNPRIVDGNDDGNPVVDMGAYEYSPPVPAEVDIEPDTLNLQSKGKWITCYIQLPEDYNAADIDPNSVFLEDEIQAEWLQINDQGAMAKFNRSDVQGILDAGEVELTISGELTDGTLFEGTDVIRVIDKGGKK